MATWKADVFVNSQVGKITTEVEASTFGGAKQQIYAKHGDVQQIVNLRQVNNRSVNSGDSSVSSSGSVWLIGLFSAAAVFLYFTPWILMLVGGVGGTWIMQKSFGKTIEEACDEEDQKAVAWILAVAIMLGGSGFVYGSSLNKDLMQKYGSSTTEQVK